MSQVRVAEKKRRRGMWPVLGFVLILVLAAIAYLIAPAVIDLTRQLLPRFTTRGTNPETVRLLFAILIFLVLGAVGALIVALFAPKRAINVNEKDLEKERKQMQEARKMDRVRQRRINREMKNIRRS
jgi:type VI protein secretion system component VasK